MQIVLASPEKLMNIYWAGVESKHLNSNGHKSFKTILIRDCKKKIAPSVN